MYSLLQPCTAMYSLAQLIYIQPCTTMYSPVQPCTALYSHMQLCKAMYILLQPCTTLQCHVQPKPTIYSLVSHIGHVGPFTAIYSLVQPCTALPFGGGGLDIHLRGTFIGVKPTQQQGSTKYFLSGIQRFSRRICLMKCGIVIIKNATKKTI